MIARRTILAERGRGPPPAEPRHRRASRHRSGEREKNSGDQLQYEMNRHKEYFAASRQRLSNRGRHPQRQRPRGVDGLRGFMFGRTELERFGADIRPLTVSLLWEESARMREEIQILRSLMSAPSPDRSRVVEPPVPGSAEGVVSHARTGHAIFRKKDVGRLTRTYSRMDKSSRGTKPKGGDESRGYRQPALTLPRQILPNREFSRAEPRPQEATYVRSLFVSMRS